MKKLTVTFLMAVAATLASADPGHYKGTGTWDQQGTDIPVDITFSIVQSGTANVYDVVENDAWKDASGNAQSYQATYTIKFTTGHNLDVVVDGKVAGSGYWYALGANHWLDFHYTANGVRVHVNNYYSAADKTLYRLGDLNDGQNSFVETLKKLD